MKKEDINYLVGQKLLDIGRASDMCWMIFGTKKDLEDQTFLALHLQCPWRISRGSRIILTNNDIYDAVPSTGDWEKINYFDKIINRFFCKGEVEVVRVVLSEINDLTIKFSDCTVFKCFVNDIKGENWRFFRKTSLNHFIVKGNGIR